MGVIRDQGIWSMYRKTYLSTGVFLRRTFLYWVKLRKMANTTKATKTKKAVAKKAVKPAAKKPVAHRWPGRKTLLNTRTN